MAMKTKMRVGEVRWTKWKRNKRSGETCRIQYKKGRNGKVRFVKNSQVCR